MFMGQQMELVCEAESYFHEFPNSLAARVRPLVIRAGAGWQIFHGAEMPGGMVFGWTLRTAFARWEANYLQATARRESAHGAPINA